MDFSLEDLPAALADRVRAATGHPDFLAIRRVGEWIVEALTDDRVTLMRLDERDDGSITERTDSFLLAAIESLDCTTDALVTARTPRQRITVAVSERFAEVLSSAREAGRRDGGGERGADWS